MYRSNRERTRDLLLEYEISLLPDKPHGAIAPLIFPQTSIYYSILSDTLYNFAKNSGYTGTKENFYEHFGSYFDESSKEIIFATFDTFPEEGLANKLYFDLEEHILYSWNGIEYIPVNTMLITNTILNGGEA